MPTKAKSRRDKHMSVIPKVEHADLRSVTPMAARESKFKVAFTEYVRAKAKIAALEVVAEEDYSEVEMTAASDEAEEATWKMIRSPAQTELEVLWRAEVAQELFASSEWLGEWADGRHRVMLAVLIDELRKRPWQSAAA